MKINNYDMSSTGVNIEVHQGFDCGMAGLRWEDNFEVLKRKVGLRDWGVYLYTPHHEIKKPDDWEDLVKISHTKENNCRARELVEEYEGERVGVRKAWEIIEYWLNDDFDWWDEKGKFWDLVAEFDWKPVRNFGVYGTRGYCQGDYAEVVIFWDDLKRLWGSEPNKAKVKEEIDHLFWDCPYWGRVEINGVEYYIDEYVEDEYEVGEDEVEKILRDIAKDTGDEKVVEAMEKFIETHNLEPQYAG